MKRLKWKLTIWYVMGFMGTLAILFKVTVRQLTLELHQKSLTKSYPDHPDWKLHGSFSTEEVNDIIWELTEIGLLYLAPMLLVTVIIGYFIAGRSLAPIGSINNQLKSIRTNNLKQAISVPEADEEFQALAKHIQDLLRRLDLAFTQIKDYAVNIAHELKTPLSIMRLKVEQAGDLIDPELGESLETELHRLNSVVEQSLLIAKAEKGQLLWRKKVFEMKSFLDELLMDFQMLAEADNRKFIFNASREALIETDQGYLKQIFHGILTNALTHGEGDVKVWISGSTRNGKRRVFVMNSKRADKVMKVSSLKIGIRVMNALTQQQEDLELRLRDSSSHYVACFAFKNI
jgi:signal transduction histidine kinase